MKKRRKKLLSLLMVGAMVLTLGGMSFATQNTAEAASPNEDLVLLKIPNRFVFYSQQKILERINQIRKEAVEQGIKIDNTQLTKENCKPLKWSSGLEMIAMMRAEEAYVFPSHTRPSGEDWDTCAVKENSGKIVVTHAENIAWNAGVKESAFREGIEQWYNEKKQWESKMGENKTNFTQSLNNGIVIGHYVNLINPTTKYVGVACVEKNANSQGMTCIAGEFSGEDDLNESHVMSSDRINDTQAILVSAKINSLDIEKAMTLSPTAPIQLQKGKSTQLKAELNWKNEQFPISKGVWKSSNEKVVTVDLTGLVKAVGLGEAEVSLTVNGVKKSVHVKVTDQAATAKTIEQIIQPPKVTIHIHEIPSLPKTVGVKYSDQTSGVAKVNWANVPEKKYGHTGSFSVEGTVEGTSQKALIEVAVIDAKADEKSEGNINSGTATEAKTSSIIQDKKTHVTVAFSEKVSEKDASLVVKKITSKEAERLLISSHKEALKKEAIGRDNVYAYEIHLTDANFLKDHPNITLTISIPVPVARNNQKATVFHFTKNGTEVFNNVVTKDGKVTVTVKSLSPFMVVYKNTNTNTRTIAGATTRTDTRTTAGITTRTTTKQNPVVNHVKAAKTTHVKKAAPKTGDVTYLWWIIAMTVMAGGVAVVSSKKQSR